MTLDDPIKQGRLWLRDAVQKSRLIGAEDTLAVKWKPHDRINLTQGTSLVAGAQTNVENVVPHLSAEAQVVKEEHVEDISQTEVKSIDTLQQSESSGRPYPPTTTEPAEISPRKKEKDAENAPISSTPEQMTETELLRAENARLREYNEKLQLPAQSQAGMQIMMLLQQMQADNKLMRQEMTQLRTKQVSLSHMRKDEYSGITGM